MTFILSHAISSIVKLRQLEPRRVESWSLFRFRVFLDGNNNKSSMIVCLAWFIKKKINWFRDGSEKQFSLSIGHSLNHSYFLRRDQTNQRPLQTESKPITRSYKFRYNFWYQVRLLSVRQKTSVVISKFRVKIIFVIVSYYTISMSKPFYF